MTPDLVLSLTGRAGGGRRLHVVDPMAGSGTVLAAARDGGHDAVGMDTDPMARVWTAPVDKNALARRAARGSFFNPEG